MGIWGSDKNKELRDSILAILATSLLTAGGAIWSSYSTGFENEFMGSSTESAGGTTSAIDEVGVLGSTAIVGIGAGITSSVWPKKVLGPFWQDSSGGWHWGNVVPYSHVERRASQVYASLHGKKETQEVFPIVVAENHETYKIAERLLGKTSPGSIERVLEILEKALLDETGDISTQ